MNRQVQVHKTNSTRKYIIITVVNQERYLGKVYVSWEIKVSSEIKQRVK